MLNQKKCIPPLGGELNPGLSRCIGGDTHHYTIEELHA